MRTRIMLGTLFVLCCAGALQAQSAVTWGGPDGALWSDAGNWGGTLPSPTVKAFFTSQSACVVDVPDAAAWQIDLAAGPLQIVDGGVLTVHDWFILGYQENDVGEAAGKLEVFDGGVLDSLVRLYVGYRGEGYLTIWEGGTVNVHSQILGIGQQPAGVGVVTLEGGSLNLLEGTSNPSLNLYTGDATLNFQGGIMTLPETPENLDYLNQAVSDGIVTAYNGAGEVIIDANETPGKITVWGIHNLRPYPADSGSVSAGQVELSWVLPDPCVPGEAVPVDVYFTDNLTLLQQFNDPGAIQIVNQQNVTSVTVQTQPKKRYYWAVDTYVGSDDDPVFGPIFSFVADNLAPEAEAGSDIVTWLVDGARVGNLSATITDDGPAEATSVQWTIVSEPNEASAIIEAPDAAETTVTLTALGEYVLQVAASDGEYTGTDTVTIRVYQDSCAAAQSLPDYVPLVGDLNGDCRVDDADMALLEQNWMQDNSLEDDWFPVD